MALLIDLHPSELLVMRAEIERSPVVLDFLQRLAEGAVEHQKGTALSLITSVGKAATCEQMAIKAASAGGRASVYADLEHTINYILKAKEPDHGEG